MATFKLSKYVPVEDQVTETPADEPKQELKKQVKVKTDESVAGTIAELLYKHFPNNDVTETDNEENPDVEVVSTETINSNEELAFEHLTKAPYVFVMLKGKEKFDTPQEEQFLSSISQEHRPLVTNSDLINTIRKLLNE